MNFSLFSIRISKCICPYPKSELFHHGGGKAIARRTGALVSAAARSASSRGQAFKLRRLFGDALGHALNFVPFAQRAFQSCMAAAMLPPYFLRMRFRLGQALLDFVQAAGVVYGGADLAQVVAHGLGLGRQRVEPRAELTKPRRILRRGAEGCGGGGEAFAGAAPIS